MMRDVRFFNEKGWTDASFQAVMIFQAVERGRTFAVYPNLVEYDGSFLNPQAWITLLLTLLCSIINPEIRFFSYLKCQILTNKR